MPRFPVFIGGVPTPVPVVKLNNLNKSYTPSKKLLLVEPRLNSKVDARTRNQLMQSDDSVRSSWNLKDLHENPPPTFIGAQEPPTENNCYWLLQFNQETQTFQFIPTSQIPMQRVNSHASIQSLDQLESLRRERKAAAAEKSKTSKQDQPALSTTELVQRAKLNSSGTGSAAARSTKKKIKSGKDDAFEQDEELEWGHCDDDEGAQDLDMQDFEETNRDGFEYEELIDDAPDDDDDGDNYSENEDDLDLETGDAAAPTAGPTKRKAQPAAHEENEPRQRGRPTKNKRQKK